MDRSVTNPASFDNELVSKASVLPAVALLLTMLLCYAMSVWVFKNKTIGGFAWVLPFFAASAAGVFLYRQQCLRVGVLSDRESGQLGRNMSIWMMLAVVLSYSIVQKSLFSGLASLFMGVPIIGVLLFGGIFVVKTMLLMHNHPERGRDEQLGAEEIAKMQADFRRDRGINDMPQPTALPTPVEVAAPRASIPEMPMPASYAPASFTPASYAPTTPVVAKPMPIPAAKSTPMPMAAPAYVPMPASAPKQDEDEIHKKILEVRLRALKEQRKAQRAAAQNQRSGGR